VHQGGFSLHDPNSGFVNVMKGECDHTVADLNKRSHAHFIQRKEPEYLPSIVGKITGKHTQHTHSPPNPRGQVTDADQGFPSEKEYQRNAETEFYNLSITSRNQSNTRGMIR